MKRKTFLAAAVVCVLLVSSTWSFELDKIHSTDYTVNSECFELLDILATMEGFDYSNVDIAKRLFGNEKINFEVKTWRGKCYYGIGTLDGKVVIVSNKLFKRPTLLAFSDSNTVKMLFRNPSEKLFEEAIKTEKIRIEGVGSADRIKVGLTNIMSRYYTFSGKKERENETINVTLLTFNLSWQNDYDGDGILNSEDVCDPYLLKENLGADPFKATLPLVKYLTCPSRLSSSREYLGSTPYLDIYDYVMDNGCGVKDTDGGKRYYTKGSICVENVSYYPLRIYGRGPYERVAEDKVISKCEQIYTDYCLDDETLVEYYYEPPRRMVVQVPPDVQQAIRRLGIQVGGVTEVWVSGGIKNTTYKCPFGCRNGACILKDTDSPEWRLPSIINGEKAYGFNPWTRGYYGCEGLEYISLKTGKSIHEITENDFFGDECVNETTLREYYLTVEKVMTPWGVEDKPVLKSEFYTCPSRCMERRCIERGDLSIVYAEPIQVVYGAPLIKGKGTAFRVIVDSTFDVELDVTFKLDLPDGEWDVPDNYPNTWTVRIPANAHNFEVMLPRVPRGFEDSEVSESNPAGLVQTQLPTVPKYQGQTSIRWDFLDVTYRNVPRPIADRVSFTVSADPGNKIPETHENNNNITARNIEVKTTRPFKIMYFIHVPNSSYIDGDNVVCSVQQRSGCKVDYNQTIDEVWQNAFDITKRSTEYLLGVSPVADTKISYGIDFNIRVESDFGSSTDYKTHILNLAKGWGYDYAISMDPCDRCGACIPGTSVCTIGGVRGTESPNAAHELLSHGILGFSLECYRCTPYHNHSRCCDVDCDSCVASDGFWVNKWREYKGGHWEQGRIVGAKYYACSAGSETIIWQRLDHLWRWTDHGRLPGGYLDLIEEFEDQNDPTVLLVNGKVYKNGTAEFGPFEIIEGFTDVEPNTSGDYYIILLDSEGNVLGRYGFNLSFHTMTYEDIEEVDTAFFVYRVSWNAKTKKIELRDKEENVLASKLVSSNRPKIEVLQPKEGEVFGENETILIKWSASDPDGDLLTCSLGLSRDGEEWIPLAGGLKKNEYSLNTNYLGRSNYIIKVRVTDGVNTAEALSGSFFVDVPEVKVERELCGNGFCNTEIENSLNCPQDCPTGIKDNICDAIKDNRVDPDCKEGVDPDDTVIYEEKITEKHRESNKIIYGGFSVFSLILVGMVIIVLKRLKKKQK